MTSNNLEVKVTVVSQALWIAFRQALLMMVDAIERELNIKPTTSQIRDYWKSGKDGAKELPMK